MNKLHTPKFQEECINWLYDQGWKEVEMDTAMTPLDNYPFKPNGLFEKDGYQVYIWFFIKGTYYFSKKFQDYVTGVDWMKYEFMKQWQKDTGVNNCILMSDEERNFIFKQIALLPKPYVWFPNYTVSLMPYECTTAYEWWMTNRETFRKAKTKKGRSLAVWKVDQFAKEEAFVQTSLI